MRRWFSGPFSLVDPALPVSFKDTSLTHVLLLMSFHMLDGTWIYSKTQRKRRGRWVDSADLSSLWDLGQIT